MTNVPALVIFDMDGVLVDSEKTFKRACSEALHQWGVYPEPEEFKPFTGMGDILYIGGVSAKHGVDYVPEMTDVSYSLYEKYAPKTLKVLPWSRPVIEALKQEGIPMCVASSAGRFKVEINLGCVEVGVSPFKALITGSDVEKKKPAPDIFLAAAKAAGEKPENCLVFEDAVSGVQAAKAAGMRACAVTTSFDRNTLTEAGANYVCDDLRDAAAYFFGIHIPR